MSIQSIRFRASEHGVILQVGVMPTRGAYNYERDIQWRDAQVEDLLDVAAFCDGGLKTSLQNSIDDLQSHIQRMQQNVNA